MYKDVFKIFLLHRLTRSVVNIGCSGGRALRLEQARRPSAAAMAVEISRI